MSTVAYQCPNCGGPLAFNPDEQGFRCEYCDSFFTDDELKERYKNLDENLGQTQADPPAQNTEEEEMYGAVYYHCPNCGGDIVTDENTAATFCFYCQSPVVLGGRLSGELKPDYVIPFALSKETTTQKFMEFCGKKKFLPKDFLSDSHIEKMTGVYVPYWLTDGEVSGTYVAHGEKVRTWDTGDIRHTETKIFRLTRTGTAHMKFMPVTASKTQDKVMMKYLHPYDNSKIEKFSMAYLSGFQADKRDIELAQASQTIDQELKGYGEQLFRDTIQSYSSVRKESSTLGIRQKVSKYALLPTWVLTYNYNGKVYIYSMNGQTGKTYGELPVAKGRLAGFCSVISAIVLAICLIVGYLI